MLTAERCGGWPDTVDHRLPSCGHDFCGHCLLGQYEMDVPPGQLLPCPLCRVPISTLPIRHLRTAETCEWLRETKGEVPSEVPQLKQEPFAKWFPTCHKSRHFCLKTTNIYSSHDEVPFPTTTNFNTFITIPPFLKTFTTYQATQRYH